MGERDEDVRDESRFFMNLEHTRADIVGQVLEARNRIAADRVRAHDFGGT